MSALELDAWYALVFAVTVCTSIDTPWCCGQNDTGPRPSSNLLGDSTGPLVLPVYYDIQLTTLYFAFVTGRLDV